MRCTRIIPCLLLKGCGLVKTVKFKNPKYVGDPINAVRIFNDKEVDELVFLDISASSEGRDPPYEVIRDIAGECFMPVSYGGGISTILQMKRILNSGVEKVVINSAVVRNPTLIRAAADCFGSQSIVVSIDAKKKWTGKYEVCTHAGMQGTGMDPVEWAHIVEHEGAGEIMLNAIDRDGTMAGFDDKLISNVSHALNIPVIAVGGAGHVEHFDSAVRAGASAVSAGSMFVFQGPHRAVLISYPITSEIRRCFRTP